MIDYNSFYRRHGARNLGDVMRPRVFKSDLFAFPRQSLWHYVDSTNVTGGPDQNDYRLREFNKKIRVNHVLELTTHFGNPRRQSVNIQGQVRDFHRKNKKFLLELDIGARDNSDPTNILITNYCFLDKSYRYQKTQFKTYYQWKNDYHTLWAHIDSETKTSVRKHFVFMDLPEQLPSFNRLEMAAKTLNQSQLLHFSGRDSLALLEIWKWLDPVTRPDSAMGAIPHDQLGKVVLVLQDKGNWCAINLGQLDAYRLVDSEVDDKQAVPVAQLKKRFLRGIMYIMSRRMNEEEVIDEEVEELTRAPDQAQGDGDEERVHETGQTSTTPEPVSTTTKQFDESDSVDNEAQILAKMEAELEEDLAQLEIQDLKSERTSDKRTIEQRQKEHQREQQLARSKTDRKITGDDHEVDVAAFDVTQSIEEKLTADCDLFADAGFMTAGDYRRRLKQIEKFSSMESPVGGGTITDFVKIEPEDLKVPEAAKIKDSTTVLDKSMLQSSLMSFDKHYINNILHKDIVGCAIATQKAGFVVTGYEVEHVEDVVNDFEIHTMRVSPLEGQPSVLRFRLPRVKEDGTFSAGGTSYLCRKQRTDYPIRKIGPTRVQLSSYFGKTFVMRSERKNKDYSLWIHDQLSAASFAEKPVITDLKPENAFDPDFKAPKVYSALAMNIAGFTANGFDFNFDARKVDKYFDTAVFEEWRNKGYTLIANGVEENTYLALDNNSNLFGIAQGQLQLLGSLEEYLSIDTAKAPLEAVEARIMGKNLPLGLVLGYRMGLSKLIETLGCEVRRVNTGQRLNLQQHEYAVVFTDETLIFSKDDKIASLILSGLRDYEKTTKNYSVYAFDKPQAYLKLLEQQGIGVRYLREVDLLCDMFVDPITEGLLKEMNEPTSYQGLLVRAAELLTTDYHDNPQDMAKMRLKGYERFAGAAYTEIVKSVRDYRGKPSRKNATIELNPYAVWKRAVQDDSSILTVKDINPIRNLREQEAVTFTGTLGRSTRSMVRGSREFTDNDIGVISEATSDSGDAGINIFTTADPQLATVRGQIKSDFVKTPTNLVSSAMLLSPGSDRDDPRRAAFCSIQQDHVIATNGYTTPSVRTGYEEVLPFRTGESYSKVAKEDGKVISRNTDGIVVQYADGQTEGFQIGRKYGKGDDNVTAWPHNLHSDLQVGDGFKQGDLLMYNTNFFAKDPIDPKKVLWKSGCRARVALLESRQTHEDASSVSKELAGRLSAKITKVKNVVVGFDQEVRNLVGVGEEVTPESFLCLLEDQSTAKAGLFDEDTLSTLSLLSGQSPRAKASGVIEKIEVFYYGDLEDMSESLRAVSMRSDREIRTRQKAQGKAAFTGAVDQSFRIDGEPLLLDTLVIRFYITGEASCGVGDKAVFANQLKTVVSEVMEYPVLTEQGETVDAIFGAQSVYNRIVDNPFVVGTTNVLLRLASEKAAKLYFGD